MSLSDERRYKMKVKFEDLSGGVKIAVILAYIYGFATLVEILVTAI